VREPEENIVKWLEQKVGNVAAVNIFAYFKADKGKVETRNYLDQEKIDEYFLEGVGANGPALGLHNRKPQKERDKEPDAPA